MASPPVLPGRAIDAGTGRHIQICDVDMPPAELLAQCRRDGDPALLPQRFPSLPEQITVDEVTSADAAASHTWIPLGVGGPGTTTVGIDLFAGAHILLVSGPSGSGRTTAAAAVAHGLRRVGIGVLAIAPPSSPLPGLLPDDAGVRVASGVSLKDADLRETAAHFGDNPYAIVVDDVSQVNLVAEQDGFMEMPTLLDESAQLSSRGRVAIVVTADATPMLNGMLGAQSRLINAAVNGGGAYILLTPADRATGLAHNLSFEPDQLFAAPPGRGYLAMGRGPVLVQLATPS
jgi:DNA segregation ATPase FtsK/SpoIIIE, S-DNA-T family